MAWLTVMAMILSAVLMAAAAAWTSDAFDAGLLSHAVVDIDGTRFNLAQVQGEHWLLVALIGFLALVAATLVVLLLVPVAVLVPLALAAAACAAVVVAVAGIGAMLLSPLILLVWAVWRVSRPRQPTATMTP